MYEFGIGNETITVEEEGYNLAESSFNKIFKSPEFMEMLRYNAKKDTPFLDTDKMNQILKDVEENKPENRFDVNTKISQLIRSEKQKFTYLYDFGDSWKHEVVVEKVFEEDNSQKYPICISGERACPPEDCGGLGGYEELMEIRMDKNHPLYQERVVDWLGEDYRPDIFVMDHVNTRLHRKRPVPVWVPPEKNLEEQKKCKHDFTHLVNKKQYVVFKCKKCDFVNKVWKDDK